MSWLRVYELGPADRGREGAGCSDAARELLTPPPPDPLAPDRVEGGNSSLASRTGCLCMAASCSIACDG